MYFMHNDGMCAGCVAVVTIFENNLNWTLIANRKDGKMSSIVLTCYYIDSINTNGSRRDTDVSLQTLHSPLQGCGSEESVGETNGERTIEFGMDEEAPPKANNSS